MFASTPTFSNPISTPMMEQRPSLPKTYTAEGGITALDLMLADLESTLLP